MNENDIGGWTIDNFDLDKVDLTEYEPIDKHINKFIFPTINKNNCSSFKNCNQTDFGKFWYYFDNRMLTCEDKDHNKYYLIGNEPNDAEFFITFNESIELNVKKDFTIPCYQNKPILSLLVVENEQIITTELVIPRIKIGGGLVISSDISEKKCISLSEAGQYDLYFLRERYYLDDDKDYTVVAEFEDSEVYQFIGYIDKVMQS